MAGLFGRNPVGSSELTLHKASGTTSAYRAICSPGNLGDQAQSQKSQSFQHPMMQINTDIDDTYINNYSFGGSADDDILLLIIGSVTPAIDQSEELPKDDEGRPIYTSQEDCRLTVAGLQYAGKQIAELTYALGRPFNDDDCTYGNEYTASDLMDTPFRFISPQNKKGYTLATNIKWMSWGSDQYEYEEHDGVIFFDWTSGDYKTAFFVALERGDDPSSYLLYWDHVEPYLSPLTTVGIAAYNDNTKCVTMQDYSFGEIDDEHDARYAERWIDSLVLTKKEICALRQEIFTEDDDDLSEFSPQQDTPSEVKPMLGGKALLAMVDSGQHTDKTELVKACGYVSFFADGREVVAYTAFFDAVTEARSLQEQSK